MLRIIALMALATITSISFANNLQISNVTFDGGEVTFDISWDNSWRGPGLNPVFHDAVWVFVKVAPNGSPQWNHVTIDVTNEGTLDVVTPPDLLGAFIRRGSAGSGTVSGTVSFDLGGELGLYPDIKVFGIEMVYIPAGSFYMGDGTSPYRFHQGNDTTEAFLVSNSDLITLGTGASDINTSSTVGIDDYPATFPNGFNAFYCMKYEISQIQYAEFLNCLTPAQQDSRTATDLSGGDFTNTYVMTNQDTVYRRNAVRCLPPVNGDPLYFFCDLDGDGIPNEVNDGQDLAMNYMSYNDLRVYLDWAGLRPMSHFQYEKTCRGTLMPISGERAWGSAGTTPPGSFVNPGTSSETFDNIGATGVFGVPPNKVTRCGFAATSTSTRLTSGATYYGAMEMSGNIAEFVCISPTEVEDEYGDGVLNIDGEPETPFSAFTIKGYSAGTFVQPVSEYFVDYATVGTARSFGSGGRGVR